MLAWGVGIVCDSLLSLCGGRWHETAGALRQEIRFRETMAMEASVGLFEGSTRKACADLCEGDRVIGIWGQGCAEHSDMRALADRPHLLAAPFTLPGSHVCDGPALLGCSCISTLAGFASCARLALRWGNRPT